MKMVKSGVILRCLAKLVDFSFILVPTVILPYPIGVIFGFLYTLIQDGLFSGQSIGKKIFRLKVLHLSSGKTCDFRQSVIRNSPLGVAVFFGIIPFWGWIILILLGIPLVALELYLVVTQEQGLRLGDVMADTKVVEKK